MQTKRKPMNQLTREKAAYGELLKQTKIMSDLIDELKKSIAVKDEVIADANAEIHALNLEITFLRGNQNQ